MGFMRGCLLSVPLGVTRATAEATSAQLDYSGKESVGKYSDKSRRDNWIRSNGPQFNTYPLAEFTATGLEGSPESYTEGEEVQFKLLGDLTVREIT